MLADPARGDYRLASASTAPSGWPATAVTPPPLATVFTVVSATTGRALRTFTVTFNQPVRGVTLDDFRLRRGREVLSLVGATLVTTDNRTFTISGVRSTNLAGTSGLRLRAADAGIVDLGGTAFTAPVATTWRMTRSVPPRW